MRELAGENDLLLTCREQADGLCLLRCETRDEHVTLPDALFGKPVVALGDYALAERAPAIPADAFSVRVTCGGPAPVHNAAAIHSITLPQGLRRIGAYAFFNCRSLSELSLTDAADTLGGGALMNCAALRLIRLRFLSGETSLLQKLLSEHAGEITAALDLANGGKARLIFPEYVEDLEELSAPHVFRYRIGGAGHAYRQCFTRGAIQFHQYDAALERLLRMHAFDAAARVALTRLRFPYALGEGARERYFACLAAHGGALALAYAENGDTEPLAFLLQCGALGPNAVSAACDRARQRGQTEALGLLLDALGRLGAPEQTKSFEL
ncbi:leucine-rich repeat protein [Agathobaculum sp. NTUH-O15-33]|uniref:leucine-rich repeat protein n=1 Tax=Agathobaculum sp. NTUH-O15-33 TaxID=3079302 RepID=UPI002958A65A|nr:leucine-rich repeat protein [Agathobaculum sp. NTUH-O15-33]WNX85645.1 leucine-rich repeat protein [Agathobaculum sp. NTUH-O15-33]